MKKLTIIVIVLITIILLTTVFKVDVTEQVVVLQFGKPVRTIQNPGLHWKLPTPIQNAVFFDKRLLEYDVQPAEVLSTDKKTLTVDNYVRWRIVDPLLFLQTLQAIPTAITRLDDIVYSEIRRELGLHNMADIITDNREKIMDAVTKASYESTLLYGIEVVDVRIKRVDLPAENEASIYARMQAERQRKANQYRSEGDEEAQKIVASTEKEKTIILADAYKLAEETRGEGEAKALQIYAKAYSADPAFYEFLKTLETYKSIIDTSTTLVLPADSKLFRLMIK
ncbi:MAG: protease modulator HflC [Planctomycetia bacterium]|nr:protease modulator HflC [Planctomycetia bacterium]